MGLVGFGRIGRAVAALLQPFGVTLLVHHPGSRSEDVGTCATLVDLPTLLRAADLVSLHVTLNASSRALVGEREFALMKPTAYLINTSRGEVVVEHALVDALRCGSIAGAALDTFEREPLAADHPLRSLPNLILTPHMVGQTREALAALVPAAVENVRRILAGELPLHCRNPSAATRWRERLRRLPGASRTAAA